MSASYSGFPPILAQKHYSKPSAFTPESLLREARRQKRIADTSIPAICILDPDGDMLRHLLARGEARLEPAWACYHTQLFSFSRGGIDFGIAAFAQVRQKPLLCFAHVTNQMGRINGDFEKGEADGSKDALDLIAVAAARLRPRLRP